MPYTLSLVLMHTHKKCHLLEDTWSYVMQALLATVSMSTCRAARMRHTVRQVQPAGLTRATFSVVKANDYDPATLAATACGLTGTCPQFNSRADLDHHIVRRVRLPFDDAQYAVAAETHGLVDEMNPVAQGFRNACPPLGRVFRRGLPTPDAIKLDAVLLEKLEETRKRGPVAR